MHALSDRSYRIRKSHEILGYLEAILRVLELIFARGVGGVKIGLRNRHLKEELELFSRINMNYNVVCNVRYTQCTVL